MRRLVIYGTIVLLVGALLWLLFLYDSAGQFRSLEPLALGECLRVEGVIGAEDIDVDRSAGLAFVSADDRTDAQARGAIYVYDLRAEGAEPVEISADFEGELRPHGISLVTGPTGVHTLFVVNHPGLGTESVRHTVEIFDWAQGTLSHRETVSGELLISPNDVVGIDRTRFYASNDHGSGGPMRQLLDDMMRRDRAGVVYWDGEQLERVASDLAYANGINISSDGSSLFVAETTRGRIREYARDPETGALEQIEITDLKTGVDNIAVDVYGSLWIAAHPKLMTFMSHARDPLKRSPSEVLFVDPKKNLDPPVRPVYLDLGEQISGASVAVPFGSRLILGSVFEPFFLVCQRQ